MSAPRYYCARPRCRLQWEDVRAKTCGACGGENRRNRRLKPGVGALSVIPDFPEHFNVSMGCVVKNRAHHRAIQRERGLQDWEPTNNSPGSQLSMERRR